MKQTRRQFIGTAAAAAAPMFVPDTVFGRQDTTAPSNRVGVALIGCGGQGMHDMSRMMEQPETQVVAVCDVDAGKAEGARKKVEDFYTKKKGAEFKGVAVAKDFREVCARKDVDAVIVATPDHWHFLAAIEAVRAKKDVYGEKPITHNYAEAKLLVSEVKKNAVIWQTGSQQRSEFGFRRAVEIVRNGLIGKVKKVEVGLPQGGRLGHKKGDEVPTEPPPGVDYDLWCGPAPKLPFLKARFHFNWRWNLAFGGGQLLDWICHHNDIAHWAIDEDLGGPLEIEASDFKYPEDRAVFDAPYEYRLTCKYANGIDYTIASDNLVKHGATFTGETGWVYVKRGALEASTPEWVKREFNPGSVKVYESNNHFRNFLDCVKSRKPAICPVEVSHHSITPGHLGYVSDRLKRKLKWDPKTEQIAGDAEAQKLLESCEYRAPWKFA